MGTTVDVIHKLLSAFLLKENRTEEASWVLSIGMEYIYIYIQASVCSFLFIFYLFLTFNSK